MTRRGLAAFFLSIAIAIVVPAIALAATTGNASAGLVPCGVSSSVDEATQCQACNIVQLVQELITFLIGIAVPIAMGMFAYAGFLYFSSGAGQSTENIGKAKGIFKNTAIGFVLALSAWLIVNTILNTVLDSRQYPNSSWFRIDCTKRPDITTIGQVIANHLGAAPEVAPAASNNPLESGVFYGNQTLTCDTANGYSLTSAGKCVNDAGDSVNPTITYTTVGGGTLSQAQLNAALLGTYQYQSQLADICAAQGYNNCQLAQAVMAIESNGKSTSVSGMGADGLMQVLPSTACSVNASLSGCSSCISGSSCSAVTQALLDPTTNMTIGVQYLKQLQSQFTTLPNVIAAYNGGAKANSASITCPGQTYWQCAANSGYAETRAYVPNVINALGQLQ